MKSIMRLILKFESHSDNAMGQLKTIFDERIINEIPNASNPKYITKKINEEFVNLV